VDAYALERLLARMAEGRANTLAELAAAVDVDVDLLEQMLRDLERAGLIRSVALACDSGCGHCPEAALCRLAHGGRIWSLTERGLHAARTQ
jgi:hypothetical protein